MKISIHFVAFLILTSYTIANNTHFANLNTNTECPVGEHWVWTDPSTFKGRCLSNTVVNCVEYDPFNNDCVLCEKGLLLKINDGVRTCSNPDKMKVIMAVSTITLIFQL